VREVLTKIDGVHSLVPDTKTQEATVKYDPAKTTPEQMAKALTDYEGGHDFTASVKQ
jgi:copper chaperone CopZ